MNQETNILGFAPLPSGHKLIGYLDGNMYVTGNLDSPNISGDIVVNKTEYKYKQYGIKLKNIAAKIFFHGQNISINNFKANDQFGNLIEGSGKFSIANKFPFSFDFQTDKFSFISTPYIQGESSGHILVSGDMNKGLAKGRFDLGPMEIKIPERFSEDIPTINVTKILEQNKAINIKEIKPYMLELDLNLNAKNQVYVRGWGVDTLIAGELKVTNNINDIHISGKLESQKGKYQEFGKLLNVKTGVLRFDGPIKPSPYLNIVGYTSVNGVEIRVILSGSIFTPDVSIESTPFLTQENALSLLLFGKNPNNISAVQAWSLADGMRRLSGHGGGFDALALGRKLLMVDDISVKNNEDDNTSVVGVGKYITDKIYLEFEQNADTNKTKTKIEVQITPKIYIEGVNAENGANSVGVNWRFSY